MEPIEFDGLRLRPWKRDAAMEAKYDLILTTVGSGAALQALFTYSRDLFAAAAIRRLAAVFVRLLEAVAAEPDIRLHALDRLLDEEDRRRSLADAQQQRSRHERRLAGARRRPVEPLAMESVK
jgi:hypothetical protein